MKKAVILAGGKGRRLEPYTTILPKPLMPVGEMPILEIVIRRLVHFGFSDITLAVGHLSELIQAYFGDGKKLDARISYSHEETPLGTAGPISLLDGITDTFLVINGDILTDINLSEMLETHRNKSAIATMAVYEKNVDIDLGVLELNSDEWVTDYIEKPKYKYTVSTGIYLFDPSVLKYLEKGKKMDLPDLILKMVKKGERIAAFPLRGYWLDIGRHDDYSKALQEFQANKEKFLSGI
ncbi:MAG TPA: sugar phosphate nucleotidyltransferase [Victivallales bacterium]|nr:sugar phosphate nucleotidyltransferase [Victivallales bacterium]